MLLLIERREPERFEAAARRWIARVCEDRAQVALEDIAAAAAALHALSREPEPARGVLAQVCDRAGLRDAAAVFRRERLESGAG